MGLLRADLQSLANGFRADGRPSLVGRFVPPLVLAAMHWMLGAMLLEHRRMLPLLDRGGDPVEYLFAHALSPGPVVAGWIGFALAQRQLFEAPELPLWQSAPLRRGRAAVQVYLRSTGTALLWALALCFPLLAQMLAAADAEPRSWIAATIALPCVVIPPLGAVLLIQIGLLAIARGAWAKIVLSATSALAAFGFPVFLLAQVFFGTSNSAEHLVRTAERSPASNPATASAARVIAESLDGPVTAGAWASLLLPVAAIVALALLVAPLHPRAVQNHELARSQRRGRRSRWPAGPVAVLRKKEFAQILQQPGALVHMLLVGAMVHLFAVQGTFVGGFLAGDRLPPELRQCAAMCVLWFLAVLMLLYTHMGRLCAADGAQWPLYLQSPTTPRTILSAKLQSIGALMLWPVMMATWAGIQWLDAGSAAWLPFLGIATAGTLVALAVVAVVGTWPWLVRPETDGRLTQGSRGLVGSMVLVFSFYLAISPAFAGWLWMLQRFDLQPVDEVRKAMRSLWPSALLMGFGFAGLALSLAIPLAKRNYGKLLAPR